MLRAGSSHAADVVDNWRHYAARFAPSVNVQGNVRIYVRTLSTGSVLGGKLAVFKGRSLRPWVPSQEELVIGYTGNDSFPTPLPFSREQWALGTYRYVETE